jgi:hypothetical protein
MDAGFLAICKPLSNLATNGPLIIALIEALSV